MRRVGLVIIASFGFACDCSDSAGNNGAAWQFNAQQGDAQVDTSDGPPQLYDANSVYLDVFPGPRTDMSPDPPDASPTDARPGDMRPPDMFTDAVDGSEDSGACASTVAELLQWLAESRACEACAVACTDIGAAGLPQQMYEDCSCAISVRADADFGRFMELVSQYAQFRPPPQVCAADPTTCGCGVEACCDVEVGPPTCLGGLCGFGSFDDSDNDSIGNAVDNCPSVANADQVDSDNDGVGDACMNTVTDADGDGIADATDNCPSNPNAAQTDSDGDTLGDACDNCPMVSQGPCGCLTFVGQTDTDADGVGDACDNCVDMPNADQMDTDGDGIGDRCDSGAPNQPVCQPTLERFDCIDNDCDGSIDEGTSGPCCPSPERCDTVDNDCDGIIDEGCCPP